MNDATVFISVSDGRGKGQLTIDGRLDLLESFMRMFRAGDVTKLTPKGKAHITTTRPCTTDRAERSHTA